MHRSAFVPSLVALMFPALLAACGGATTGEPQTQPPATDGTDGGADSAPHQGTPLPVPHQHRASPEACTGARAPGISAADAKNFSGECKSDADCVAGKNGRCELAGLSRLVCTYDECTQDSDCASGVCDCRNGAHFGANTCFKGNCVIDADCPGSYCSPSGTTIGSNCMQSREGPVPSSSFGYFCHTAADECVDDSDCKGDEPACVFKTDVRKWGCLDLLCTGGGDD